jgi:tetratricopeptide (TPR) repeat protein
MNSEPAAAPANSGQSSHQAERASPRRLILLLGGVLVAATLIAGAPDLGAPWLMGDEFVFIVNDPDVNPAADAEHRDRSLAARLASIGSRVHDDLHQPLPLLSYAVQWDLTRGNPLGFRLVDVLLHAANALLLWWVLARLLARSSWSQLAPVSTVAWALALLWALHPALVMTWAADMGRTHLLSAFFGLVALGFYVRALSRAQTRWFVGAVAALVLAMLAKPIPGFVLVAFVLEGLCRGWRRTLISPRVYIVGVICAAFAGLTMWTSAQSGLAEDASKGLFGDPVARSALAVWIYFRDLVAPAWLAVWHLPDPRTGWNHPLVWVGLMLGLASAGHAIWSWRRAHTRLITLGWVWTWATLLPVIGLIGAREAAAADRYLYQPLMGLLLVLGVVLFRGLAASSVRAIVPVAGVIALGMLLVDLPQCAVARSTIQRARTAVQLNSGDPRALEGLAAAYDFAQDHPLPRADQEAVPPGVGQLAHFHKLWLETLTQAADSANLAHYFPGPDDRGPFHWRLSYHFLRAGEPQRSLDQALEAQKLLPDAFMTWKRLAYAYQALGQLTDAACAYDECAKRLPADPLTRAVYFTDFGSLLIFDLDRDAEACREFAAAVETGRAPLQAKLGLALCQIRYGDGSKGFQLISEVLRTDPGNVRAGLVLAEYHLRSHHWEQAAKVYDAILRDDPTHYTALRGFHEVCLQTGHMERAVIAWQDAAQREPARREFRSYLVWALALARMESAAPAANELLRDDPDNPFACLALMLHAIRTGDLPAALVWVQRACTGSPVAKAREFERAAAALRLLLSRNELPSEAVIARSVIVASGDFPSAMRIESRGDLDDYAAKHPDSKWNGAAREVRERLSDVKRVP